METTAPHRVIKRTSGEGKAATCLASQQNREDVYFSALPSANLTSPWPFCSVFIWDILKGCGQSTVLPSCSSPDVVQKDQHSTQGVGREKTPHCHLNPRWWHGAQKIILHRYPGWMEDCRAAKLCFGTFWFDGPAPVLNNRTAYRSDQGWQLSFH